MPPTMSKVIMGNGDFTVAVIYVVEAGKQHKDVYSFFLVPCGWIALSLNQAKPNSYYP